MIAPYKHKLGELGEEHFDGDPIPKDLNPEQKAQADQLEDRVMKKAMPKNAIQKPVAKQSRR